MGVVGRAYNFLRERLALDTRVWRILRGRATQKFMRRKAISLNATQSQWELLSFPGTITICTMNTFEAHLACDGSHLRGKSLKLSH